MTQQAQSVPVALSIAGLDPSGGAGIIADIRAFTAFGCLPTAAITSVTFQNASRLYGAEHLSVAAVRGQVMAIVDGNNVACVKTGMLATPELVQEVARLFRETNLPPPVVDPVVTSTSGYALIGEDALGELLRELLPLARLITPNIPEAEQITGLHINDEAGMGRAARALRRMGARAVLIKGGHLGERNAADKARETGDDKQAIDYLDNEGRITIFRADWIGGGSLRGSGCRLSAAIAACLGKGMTLEEAVGAAKRFLTEAIRTAG